ncbi:hypothetical protein LEP1GSC082_1006 [Leptospira kirschneri str. H2]|nr:hypothetical protein LEP1GSC082_1006 [Leptospira kirschneri str. H2]
MSISQINNYESKVQPVLRPALSRTRCETANPSLSNKIPFKPKGYFLTYNRKFFSYLSNIAKITFIIIEREFGVKDSFYKT